MKKIYSIVTVFLIAISFSTSENFVKGQEDSYDTTAIVHGAIPIIGTSYIVIRNNDMFELWNSSTGMGIRSDSYMEDSAGDVLSVYVEITDADGFSLEAPYHTVEAVLRDISIPHTITLYLNQIIDSDTALFSGYEIIYNSMMQDIAKVNITCYDILDDVPATNNDTEIFSPLYINPITSSSFTPSNIDWLTLTKGGPPQVSDNNPYEHRFNATCLGQNVGIGYNLSIKGSDLESGDKMEFASEIPIENMNFSFNSAPNTSMDELYILVNSGKLIANNQEFFDFYLTIPIDTPAGEYSGTIDLLIEPEE